MKYAEVQESIESYVKSSWTFTEIAFEDVGFDSNAYDEFMELTVNLGDGEQTSVTKGHYRVIGLVMMTIHVRPAQGSARKLDLANKAAAMLVSKVILPTPPLEAPAINLLTPSLVKDLGGKDGWVRAQVSCPFYYDLEQ